MTSTEGVNNSQCHIVIEEELTIYTAAVWKERLLAASRVEGGEIVLEMSAVGELDTAGLQLLILLKKEYKSQGKRLRLMNPSPAVMDVLTLCGLGDFFESASLDQQE